MTNHCLRCMEETLMKFCAVFVLMYCKYQVFGRWSISTVMPLVLLRKNLCMLICWAFLDRVLWLHLNMYRYKLENKISTVILSFGPILYDKLTERHVSWIRLETKLFCSLFNQIFNSLIIMLHLHVFFLSVQSRHKLCALNTLIIKKMVSKKNG